MALAINHNSTQCQKNSLFQYPPICTACCIALFITTLSCCSKTRMPIFNFIFQMVLRRFLVQTRRLLHDRKWSKSLSTGLLVIYITAQFLHRPLPRGNAVPSKIDQFNFIGIDYAVLNTSYTSPTL